MHRENFSIVGSKALKRLNLEGFKNLGVLRTGNRKSLLKFLGPLVLVVGSFFFFHSFVYFDHLIWSCYLHLFLSLWCCLVFFSSLPCWFVSANFQWNFRCRTEKQMFLFHQLDGVFLGCACTKACFHKSPFFSGVSFSDHFVLQVSTELKFSLQLPSSIATSDFHLNSVSVPSWISHVKLSNIDL